MNTMKEQKLGGGFRARPVIDKRDESDIISSSRGYDPVRATFK